MMMDMEHRQTIQPPQKLKDFLPLVIIFAAIILFAGFRQYQLGYWDAVYAMRNFMAGFFLVFGGFKVLNWNGFAEAYSMYDILAKRSRFYAYLYPLLELGLGLAYLFAFQIFFINWTTLILMAVSSIGVANELLKKEQIYCACLGTVFKIPMTKVTLLEDLLMAVMALTMIFSKVGV